MSSKNKLTCPSVYCQSYVTHDTDQLVRDNDDIWHATSEHANWKCYTFLRICTLLILSITCFFSSLVVQNSWVHTQRLCLSIHWVTHGKTASWSIEHFQIDVLHNQNACQTVLRLYDNVYLKMSSKHLTICQTHSVIASNLNVAY